MTEPCRDEQGRDWEMRDLLHSICRHAMPPYIEELAREVQDWLAQTLSGGFSSSADEMGILYDRQIQVDLEEFLSRIEWVHAFADVIPSMKEHSGHEDAVVFSLGPIIQDEAFRMLVDHAALFGRATCKRVWLISDTWVIGDIVAYIPHLHALARQGVEVNFILVTPWGWTLIPWEHPAEVGDTLTWNGERRSKGQQNSSGAGHCPPQTEN